MLSARKARTSALPPKLTGWKIDIKSQSQAEEDMDIADADSEADRRLRGIVLEDQQCLLRRCL